MKYGRLLIVVSVICLGLVLLASPLLTSCAAPAPAPAPKPTPAAAPTPAPAEKFEVKFADYLAPTHQMITGIIAPFGKELEAKSNGRIKVTFYHSETLGKAAALYDMVATGQADMAMTNPSYSPSRFPLSDIMSLSFAYNNGAQANVVVEKMRPLLEREYPEVKLLNFVQMPPFPLGLKNKRVANLGDLKGLKIRTSGAAVSNVMSLLGAVPVAMPASDMYVAMERGTVDGLTLAFSSWTGYKVEEVAKYGLECGGLGSPVQIYVMNKEKFNKMPADLQKIILDAAAQLPAKTGAMYDANEIAAKKMLQAKGIELVSLSDAEIARWKTLAMPAWDKWITDTKKLNPAAEEVMAAFKKACEEAKK